METEGDLKPFEDAIERLNLKITEEEKIKIEKDRKQKIEYDIEIRSCPPPKFEIHQVINAHIQQIMTLPFIS